MPLRIDLQLSIGSVENVDNLKILEGEKFTLKVHGSTEQFRIFSDKDAVLSHTEDEAGRVVEVKANSWGRSDIQFQNPENGVIAQVFKVEVISRDAAGVVVKEVLDRPRSS